MLLSMNVEGASATEIDRGLRAARAVFDQAGVTPYRAAMARFNVEAEDEGFFAAASSADYALFHLWDAADVAALDACCTGWDSDRKPDTANLELVYDDELALAPLRNAD